MGCCSNCLALGRCCTSRIIIAETKEMHAGDMPCGKGRMIPAEMACLISSLLRPSKGRWPAQPGSPSFQMPYPNALNCIASVLLVDVHGSTLKYLLGHHVQG